MMHRIKVLLAIKYAQSPPEPAPAPTWLWETLVEGRKEEEENVAVAEAWWAAPPGPSGRYE